jgi:hypothetical protein
MTKEKKYLSKRNSSFKLTLYKLITTACLILVFFCITLNSNGCSSRLTEKDILGTYSGTFRGLGSDSVHYQLEYIFSDCNRTNWGYMIFGKQNKIVPNPPVRKHYSGYSYPIKALYNHNNDSLLLYSDFGTGPSYKLYGNCSYQLNNQSQKAMHIYLLNDNGTYFPPGEMILVKTSNEY